MEFAWTASQEAYRQRVRNALDELLPDDWDTHYAPQGYGSADQIAFSRTFGPQLAERHLLVPHWPIERGGNGAEPWDQFILAEEMKWRGEPRGPQYMNVNWLGPTLMKYGTPEQQEEHLGRIARGEVIWCQGYSEPGAGTDLAALQTRAEPKGNGYVINGQKIWTSYSRKADFCFLLARTGSGRKDISIFIVPMDTPGVKVVPFPGLVGEGHLNEVFFTDVEVPGAARVGEEGRAWEIITYALSFERVGIPRYHVGKKLLDKAVRQLAAQGRGDDPIIKARVGRIFAKFEAARLLTYVVVDQRAKQRAPSVDANISRVTASEACTDLTNFLMEYVPDCLTDGDPILREFHRGNIAATIAAGTYELQLNLIAQQALDLPRGA
jgi:alkylation response protein AidB-like acyl-CoA dehydrogenase